MTKEKFAFCMIVEHCFPLKENPQNLMRKLRLCDTNVALFFIYVSSLLICFLLNLYTLTIFSTSQEKTLSLMVIGKH